MEKIKERIRYLILAIIVLVTLGATGIQLMSFQIVNGEDYLVKSQSSSSGIQTIYAPRGEIVDSNGSAIVRNKVGYNVIVEKAYFPEDLAAQNKILLKVANLLKMDGIEYVESIPVSKNEPYTFNKNSDSDISKLKNNLRLQTYATADDCIQKIVDKYEISDEYTNEEKRIIAGIRYEMQIQQFSLSNSYVLAKDIPMATVTKLKEVVHLINGIDVEEQAIRVYAQSDILAHVVGTVGPIYAEEYDTLKDKGYLMNDTLGKSGLEKSLEGYLRGKNGKRSILLGANKEVVSVKNIEDSVPGNTIKLTIDSDFQREIQNVLANHIDYLHERNEKGSGAYAGAIAVLDAKTGAVLALATYPTYDTYDYINNYSEVLNADYQPLINRALDGMYRPGSTFKTVTATAALNEGIITGNDTVLCTGTYNYFSDYKPTCLGRHGNINVVNALFHSCNIFFYDTGRRLGITNLSEYANNFGLGVAPNLEIGGSAGAISNPERFEKLEMLWTPGAVVQTSIGQGETIVSPLQMAIQASVLANNGVRYQPYMVEGIYSYTMDEVVNKTQPKVLSTIKDKTGSTFDLVRQGMILAAKNTPVGEFSLNSLPYEVAIKTGTPQTNTPSGVSSSVIGYAPADNPEIAFAVFIEDGDYSKFTVRKIIDAYINTKK